MNIKTYGGIKRRVFVSFNPERDRPLRDFFVNQGRKSDATWSVVRWSDPYDDENSMWATTTTGRIKQCDMVVVLLGPTTFMSKGVLKEITIAEIVGKNVVQVIVPGAGSPHFIPNAGRVVHWEWDTVKRAMLIPPKSRDRAQTARA